MIGRSAILALTLFLAACGGTESSNTSVTDLAEPAGQTGPLIFCDAVKTRVTAPDCDDLTALKGALYRGGAAINVDSPMQRGETYTVTLLVDSRNARVIEAIETPQPTPTAQPSPSPARDPADEPADEPIGNMSDDAAGNMMGNANEPAPSPPPPPPPPPEEDRAETPGQVLEKLPGETERFAPWVGPFMRAELRADGFEIVPMDGDGAKEVPDNSPTRWSWQVTPREGGPQTLFVTTKVEGRVSGRVFVLAGSETFRSVTVVVGTMDWLKDQFVYFTDWLKSLEGLVVAITAVVVAVIALRALFRRKRTKPGTPPETGE